MKKNNIVLFLIITATVGVLAFFGGMKYQQTKAADQNFFRDQMRNRQGNITGQVRFGNTGRPVVGEIILSDENSITVKLEDGSSKIVFLPDTAVISKTDTGEKTDLRNGMRVGVFGTENSDGSMTAQNVQLNPMFRGITGQPTGSQSSR